MKTKIDRKRYYRISFILESPLMLGSGVNVETDQDILCDKSGHPYIPASAIAGVARDLLENYDHTDLEKIEHYFGVIRQDGNNDSSRISFYDGVISPEDRDKTVISVRDSVALDQYKTAISGAKFDAEVLETGIHFITYMEQNISERDENFADRIADFWIDGMMRFGAKTMRGYGQTKSTKILVQDIKLDWNEEAEPDAKKKYETWLQYNMYQEEFWKDAERIDSSGRDTTEKKLCLKLIQNGGISVRTYTTDIVRRTDNNIEPLSPDSVQLTLADQTAVIPGTSWAGAFRHRMYELVPELKAEKLFGEVEKKSTKRSQIRFNETKLNNTISKAMSHNAINRFSGAVEDTALFTEETRYNGETELVISWTDQLSTNAKVALAAAVADLHYGLLSVGGLTGIGRGCFTVDKINDREVDSDHIYQQVLDELDSKNDLSEKTSSEDGEVQE